MGLSLHGGRIGGTGQEATLPFDVPRLRGCRVCGGEEGHFFVRYLLTTPGSVCKFSMPQIEIARDRWGSKGVCSACHSC